MVSSLRTVLLLTLGIAAAPQAALGQPPAKTEKEKLIGDWIVVSNQSLGIVAEIFGQVPEPDNVRFAVISPTQWNVKAGNDLFRMAYQVDPTKSPKTVDLVIEPSPGKKATLQGIYDLDGDQLTVCFDSFGEKRPANFPPKVKDPEGKRLGTLALLVFRRVGANPKQDTLDRDKLACAKNLATIARVIHDQVSETRCYPTAAIHGPDGAPLLSWRVALLERLDEGKLFKEFKTDEPWDSAHNQKLIKKMPKLYALPGVETKEPGMTFFQVFTGEATLFHGTLGVSLTRQLQSDGPAMMIVEAREPVIWTKPQDLPYDARKPLPKLGRLSDEGFHAAMSFLGDQVRFVPRTMPEAELRALIELRPRGEKKGK
jgi:uncharacterized protein (TIGR03067 family)